MEIKKFVFNPISENTYIVSDEKTKECVIIDAGCRAKYEKTKLSKYIDENGLKVVHLINTHLHFDHVYGNKYVFDTYGVRPEGSANDKFFITNFKEQLGMFNMPMDDQTPDLGSELKEGDIITCGDIKLEVIETPGHSRGGLCFIERKEGVCFTGDTIFRGSVGRTDLPGGSQKDIVDSIKNKLFTLDDNVVLYPGHGDETTVSFEKLNNPYIF